MDRIWLRQVVDDLPVVRVTYAMDLADGNDNFVNGTDMRSDPTRNCIDSNHLHVFKT